MKTRKIRIIILLMCIVSLTGFCQSAVEINREKLSEALAKYDNFEIFSGGLCLVEKNGKYGFIDKSGKEIVPCIYYYANYFEGGVAKVKKYFNSDYSNGLFGYVNQYGKEIVPCIYIDEGNGGYLYSLWRGMDKVIEAEITTAKYQQIGYFSENLCPVTKDYDGKWGFIDINGKEIIPCIYDEVPHFAEGMALVSKNEKVGFIDMTGKEIIPCIYDAANNFSEGLAFVLKNNKWGFIDKSGKEVIPCINNYSLPPEGERRAASYMDTYQYSGEYDDCESESFIGWKFNIFIDGLALVIKNRKEEIIDRFGNKVFSGDNYDYIYVFSEGLARVEKDDKYGFIDMTGKEIIPCIYDAANNFSEGLAIVKKDDKYGFIDKTGKEIIPFIYDKAKDFHDGLAFVAVVKIIEEMGRVRVIKELVLIDKIGNERAIIHDHSFAYDPFFSDDLARIETKNDVYFIDKEGYLIGRGYVERLPYWKERDNLYNQYVIHFPNKSAFEQEYDEIGKEAMLKKALEIERIYKDERDNLYDQYKLYFQNKSAFETQYDKIGKEAMTKIAQEAKKVYIEERDNLHQKFAKYYTDKSAFELLYDRLGKEAMPKEAQQEADRQDFESFKLLIDKIKSANFDDKKDKSGMINEVANFNERALYPLIIQFVIENNKDLNKQWEKDSSWFRNQIEFYESYSSGEYKTILKEKKK